MHWLCRILRPGQAATAEEASLPSNHTLGQNRTTSECGISTKESLGAPQVNAHAVIFHGNKLHKSSYDATKCHSRLQAPQSNSAPREWMLKILTRYTAIPSRQTSCGTMTIPWKCTELYFAFMLALPDSQRVLREEICTRRLSRHVRSHFKIRSLQPPSIFCFHQRERSHVQNRLTEIILAGQSSLSSDSRPSQVLRRKVPRSYI